MPQETNAPRNATAPKKSAPKKSAARTPRSSPTAGDNARVREDGKGRTPLQLERQERAYELHLLGVTYRQIGAQLAERFGKDGKPVDKDTIGRDIASERQRRRDALGADADAKRDDAIARCLQIMRSAFSETNPKFRQHALANALKAQELMNKTLGIDAPTKIEVGLQDLLTALDTD